MKPHKDVVIGVGVDVLTAVQRLCCEQTVLLVSASEKLRLSISNQADPCQCTVLHQCRE